MITLREQIFAFSTVDMKAHAMTCWPEESCGLVIGDLYVPCVNVAPEPKGSFLIAPVEMARPGIQAIVHSHCMPYHHQEPSREDMKYQMNSGLPWGIILCSSAWASQPMWFGDFRLDDPLEGRHFLNGVHDCYSLVRSFYWQEYGVKLIDVPRDRFTVQQEDLYVRHFTDAGGYLVGENELRRGDVLLMMLEGKVTHHAAIYLGDGHILHHLHDKRSMRSNYYAYKQFVRYRVRRAT